MHVVAVLALDSFALFDLAVPSFVFGSAYLAGDPVGGEPLYEVQVCGPPVDTRAATTKNSAIFGLTPTCSWADAARADTLVVPGLAHYAAPPPETVVEVLRRAHARGARTVSVCNGVFPLAATGLLDGWRAAVHWTHAKELAGLYPAIDVDPAVLYVDNGDVVTSAGGAAGLDMCLHLVRRDHGADVAAATARHTVLPLQRDGGQAQFIVHALGEDDGGSLEPLMRWMQENLDRPLTLGAMAQQASMSVRTLNRRFRAQTGTTPLQWLIKARLHRAQQLLETTDLPVEEVAQRAGFGTAIALRQHFRRSLGTSPLLYRRTFASTQTD